MLSIHPRAHRLLLAASSLFATFLSSASAEPQNRIRPYTENPYYWQYQGEPIAIFGATDTHNLFQWPAERLIPHLDELVAAGGNQVRNTMSDREDGDLRAFATTDSGKYDLTKWNPVYWKRFDTLLRETQKRGIIVQIEFWDRFDHSRDQWKTDPYNPANNINYSYEESGFEKDYPKHPNTNLQPFFFTPPSLKDIPVVRRIQDAFIAKVLEHAAPFDHVLFCIDNETNGTEEWAVYWAEFVRKESARLDHPVMLTQMWDEWNVLKAMHQRTVAHPERFDYIDLSQNTMQLGDANWKNAQTIRRQIADQPRPINSTKLYGSPEWNERWQGRDAVHALDTFWRNQLGGFATTRFHRPGGGLGLSPEVKIQLTTARKWVGLYDIFRAEPDADFTLLGDRKEDEAYASTIPGEAWTLFFPAAGDVVLKTGVTSELTIRWANLTSGVWTDPAPLKSDETGNARLTTPEPDRWLALVRVK